MNIVQLEGELQPAIQQILTHPFLERIAGARLTMVQLRLFVEQYHVYCQYFPRFLAATAANIPSDEMRMPIMENLWEEHGEGQLIQSHRALFLQFAQAIELTSTQLQETIPLPSTQKCVTELLDFCLQQHYLKSLGALGPGTEFFTSAEYKKIADGLLSYGFLTEQNIQFWTVHIDMDDGHYSNMVAVLEPYLQTERYYQWIKQGAKKALDLELLFWNGLEEGVMN